MADLRRFRPFDSLVTEDVITYFAKPTKQLTLAEVVAEWRASLEFIRKGLPGR